MASCSKLDLGGRTVEDPCEATWLWCTIEDFDVTRGLLVTEHNALVRTLDGYNALVAAGKAKWTQIPSAAWKVYEESWALLKTYEPDWAYPFFNSNVYKLKAPITAFVATAMRVHSAACDVDNARQLLGDKLPSPPTEPTKEKGVVEQAVDFTRDLGSGLVKLAGIAVVGVLGYTWLNRRR